MSFINDQRTPHFPIKVASKKREFSDSAPTDGSAGNEWREGMWAARWIYGNWKNFKSTFEFGVVREAGFGRFEWWTLPQSDFEDQIGGTEETLEQAKMEVENATRM